MGLDMYLHGKVYVSKYNNEEKCKKIWKLFPEIPTVENLKSVTLSFEVGYWRKANQIHQWFVENIQDGEDDCKEYYVSKEDLQKLLDLCKQIKEKIKFEEGDIHISTSYKEGKEVKEYKKGQVIVNAEEIAELLPSQSGFFFGSTDYDEYYMNDIDNTIEIIENCLKVEDIDYYYQSSW